MMAFRDVTVQFDSQKFCVSSSVMESSTVTLGSCVQQDGAPPTVTSTSTKANSFPVFTPAGLSQEPPPAPAELPAEPIDPPPPPQEPPPPPESEFEEGEQDVEFPAPPPSEEELGEDDQPPLTPLDKMAAPQSPPDVVVVVPPPAELPQVAPTLLGSSPPAAPLEVNRCSSETADNSSEQMSSSSTSTEARSTSEASSKEALQAMILSLPRYQCENPASCKSPTLSTDVMRKRLYRIGLNLFNV